MPSKGTGEANLFSSLINAELRAEMARQRISLRALQEKTDIGKSRLGQVINQDEAPLNTNELDAICRALRLIPHIVLEDAERALMDKKYALAADPDNQIDLDEGDLY